MSVRLAGRYLLGTTRMTLFHHARVASKASHSPDRSPIYRSRTLNSSPHTLAPLSRTQPQPLFPLRNMWTLLYDLLALRQHHLHMTWIAHIRVDPTVRTVRPTTLLGRLVHLNMLHNEVRRIKPFSISVGFRVLQQINKVGRGFHRPARFGDAEFFAYCVVLAHPHLYNSNPPPCLCLNGTKKDLIYLVLSVPYFPHTFASAPPACAPLHFQDIVVPSGDSSR